MEKHKLPIHTITHVNDTDGTGAKTVLIGRTASAVSDQTRSPLRTR